MSPSRSRWYGVVTIFVIVAISYIDRINLSVLITDSGFLQHLGLNRSDRVAQGLLATAFMVGYGVSAIVLTPFLTTTLGVRNSLLVGLTLWGVVTFTSPQMGSYGLLLGSRLLLGISEGPLFSLASGYIKAHFENSENGKPNSIVNMGTGLGLAIGFPFIGYMLASSNWQNSFYVLGLLNLAIGIPLVLAFVRMPKGDAELSRVTGGAPLARVGALFRGALHTRNLLVLTILTSAFLSYLWGSSNWLPSYLKEARGFSLREMGWLASLPQYASIVAVFCGGLILDRIERRHVPLLFLAASCAVALSVLLAINTPDRNVAAYGLVAASFFWGLQSPAIPSTVQYCSQPQHTASAFGVVNGVGSLVAGFMPSIMGFMIGSGSGPGVANAASGSGFFAGFGTLIGTQVVVFACGLILWMRERQPVSVGVAQRA